MLGKRISWLLSYIVEVRACKAPRYSGTMLLIKNLINTESSGYPIGYPSQKEYLRTMEVSAFGHLWHIKCILLLHPSVNRSEILENASGLWTTFICYANDGSHRTVTVLITYYVAKQRNCGGQTISYPSITVHISHISACAANQRFILSKIADDSDIDAVARKVKNVPFRFKVILLLRRR